jgi:hypothetical protein
MCTETYGTFHLFAVTVVGALRYVYSYSSGKINEARSRGVAHLLTNLSTLGSIHIKYRHGKVINIPASYLGIPHSILGQKTAC